MISSSGAPLRRAPLVPFPSAMDSLPRRCHRMPGFSHGGARRVKIEARESSGGVAVPSAHVSHRTSAVAVATAAALLGLAGTADAGWTPVRNLPTGTTDSLEPVVAVAPNGTATAAWTVDTGPGTGRSSATPAARGNPGAPPELAVLEQRARRGRYADGHLFRRLDDAGRKGSAAADRCQRRASAPRKRSRPPGSWRRSRFPRAAMRSWRGSSSRGCRSSRWRGGWRQTGLPADDVLARPGRYYRGLVVMAPDRTATGLWFGSDGTHVRARSRGSAAAARSCARSLARGRERLSATSASPTDGTVTALWARNDGSARSRRRAGSAPGGPPGRADALRPGPDVSQLDLAVAPNGVSTPLDALGRLGLRSSRAGSRRTAPSARSDRSAPAGRLPTRPSRPARPGRLHCLAPAQRRPLPRRAGPPRPPAGLPGKVKNVSEPGGTPTPRHRGFASGAATLVGTRTTAPKMSFRPARASFPDASNDGVWSTRGGDNSTPSARAAPPR